MTGIPAPGSPPPGGLIGVLRAWLQAWSRETGRLLEDRPSETEALRPHSYGPVRVLVVDDNPVNLVVISALMESRGFSPWLAADGAEAVTLACAMHFDLILMDLQMPILGGFDATSAIRRFESASLRPAVPVLAYSSTAPEAEVLATHGMNGRLTKPCGDQELEDCLVQWCPSYQPTPAAGVVTHDKDCWHPASQKPGQSGASLR